MTSRADVVAEAISWLGTPYHHMGRVKGAGVDCGQLLLDVYNKAGLIPEIDVGYYPSDWHLHRSEEQYLSWVSKYAKPTNSPRLGDIVVYKYGRCISHGAIVINYPLVLHAYLGLGCVYSKTNDAELAGREAGYYTLWDD